MSRIINIYLETGPGQGIPVYITAEDNETVEEVVFKAVKQSRLDQGVKGGVLEALERRGESQVIPYVIDLQGQKVNLSLKDQIGKVLDTYGTGQIYLDVTRIVGK